MPEGIEGRVPYKGLLADWCINWSAAYAPAWATAAAPTFASCGSARKFLRVTSAGLRESHVHDVIITKEAPNYRLE